MMVAQGQKLATSEAVGAARRVMLAMRPSATAIERIQLNQAGAAGISEEASRSSPKPRRRKYLGEGFERVRKH